VKDASVGAQATYEVAVPVFFLGLTRKTHQRGGTWLCTEPSSTLIDTSLLPSKQLVHRPRLRVSGLSAALLWTLTSPRTESLWNPCAFRFLFTGGREPVTYSLVVPWSSQPHLRSSCAYFFELNICSLDIRCYHVVAPQAPERPTMTIAYQRTRHGEGLSTAAHSALKLHLSRSASRYFLFFRGKYPWKGAGLSIVRDPSESSRGRADQLLE